MNFEATFQNYINVLNKYKKELNEKVKLDLNQFTEIKKQIKNEAESISYSFNRVRLNIPKRVRPSHCIPRDLSDVNITLSMEGEVIFKKNNTNIEDPFIKIQTLNFVLDNSPYTSSWHLDKHSDPGIPTSFHPLYHLTFGGKYMEDLDVPGELKFGHSLIIRAPRISHPPMELILGVDYVLQHYFVNNELDLLSDVNYKQIINALKTKFWKPYFLCLLKPYCSNMIIDGQSLNFDSLFVNKVNGIYS